MCVICGCGDDPRAGDGGAAAEHGHHHHHRPPHPHPRDGAGPARNRIHFAGHAMLALNVVSSPGSGKTTLPCPTIPALCERAPRLALGVIEGDQQTSDDADRIRAIGAPAIIENVGNQVCPAMWDLGEAAKVAILSVTEGEDKPLKCPHMFAAARPMVLNKTDPLPHVDFDVERRIEYARRVNPAIEVPQLSARNGLGVDGWLDWIAAARGRGDPGDRSGRRSHRRARTRAARTRAARTRAARTRAARTRAARTRTGGAQRGAEPT